MKNIAFLLMISIIANVAGMEPTNQVFYSEMQQFLGSISSHGKRQQWNNKCTKVHKITLNFDGRKQFIESVRSNNDSNHINNFEIIIPIDSAPNVRIQFSLINRKHYSTTYGFSVNGKWKPYLYDANKRENGILDDLVFVKPSHPPLYYDYINYFAINVLRILKLSQKPLTTEEPNRINRVANQCVMNTAIEIAAMILTTERARDEYSLLISYIEFYKLKHTDASNQRTMLLNMFDKENPILRFPAAPCGASRIQSMPPEDIYDEFTDMLPYSPYYEKLQLLPESMHDVLVNLFYEEKLERLMAISENRKTRQKAKFKKLVEITEAFFKAKMRKIFAEWKDLTQYTGEISEPENCVLTLQDQYVDVFDEYDENKLNPTMP